jgi:ketosteroid isomerase-like protein
MKKPLLFIWALAIPLFARATESADTSDKATITALENDWLKAFVDKDEAKMRSFVNPDCWLIDSQGNTATLQSLIADLKSGTYTVQSMHMDDIQVRVMGDWAVVLGLETEKSQTNGQDSSGQFRFLDTWHKRDGHWLCVGSAAIQVKSEKQ